MKYLPPDFISNEYFYIGELYRKQGGKNHHYYYKKALSTLLNVKDKNIYHKYKLASLYKRLKNWKDSIACFNTVLSQSRLIKLNEGAFFHLGEIYYNLEELSKADYYFKEALKLNPNHLEAQKYYKILENESSIC